MATEAKIICDSINPDGQRLTTFVLKYQRMIHSELMTHRMLSRNASSSRAIPVKKIIQAVIDDPAMPVHWGSEKAGMQSGGEVEHKDSAIDVWLHARDRAVESARALVEYGVHKSLVNRILEPWHHIVVVCSATEWANFFTLRAHKDAQPEFQHLAEMMATEYRKNKPAQLGWNEWHLPFITDAEKIQYPTEYSSVLVKCSTARCARVSYLTHDGQTPSIEKDIELHDRLVVSKPAHASPSEHAAHAYCTIYDKTDPEDQRGPRDLGNFKGWLQYRKLLTGENTTTFPWDVCP